MARDASWRPDLHLLILLGGTVLALVLAALVKAPCLNQPWTGSQYRDLCYNDLQPSYRLRSLDENVMPYVGAPGMNPDGTPKGFLEYPILTGLVMYLAALPATSNQEFFVWNALILSLFALGTTGTLYLAVGDSRRVAFFAAGPPLVLYAFHNWDLIAVFFATLGLYAFTRGRWILSGVSLGLGAAAKIYPAFFVPVLGLALLRCQAPKFDRSAKLVGSAAATFLVLNMPFALINPALWWKTYSFHLSRGATFESPWFVVVEYAQRFGVAELDFYEAQTVHAAVALPLFAGLVAWLGWRIWARRLPTLVGCLSMLLFFLLLNKIWSVQYTLWILPFFTFLPLDWKKYAALEAADVGVYATVLQFQMHLGRPEGRIYFDGLAWEVLARTGILVWILLGTVMKQPEPTAAGASEAILPTTDGRDTLPRA